jgi:hypothetical protein
MAQKTKTLIASLVTTASILFLYFSIHGFGPPIDTAPHRALGQTLAQEAIKLRGGAGRITVIARDTESQKNPFADAQLKAFRQTLKSAGVDITSTRLLKFNAIRLLAVPGGDLLDMMKKASEDDVIVSLLGPPDLSDAQIAQAPEKRPKIIAVCSGWAPRQVNLRRLFEQGLLTTAVISRNEPRGESTGNAQEVFNKNFALVTSANISDLPLVASSTGAK